MTAASRPARARALGVAALVLLASCSHGNPYYDANKPHHRPAGFQNVDPALALPRPLSEFLRWKWDSAFLDVAPPKRDLSPVPANLALVKLPTNHFAVTWIGHATALVQIGTVRVLTDPQFSERASPVQWAGPKRHQPPGVALADLPHVDVVLISHNHYDHLDEGSVRALNAQQGGAPLFVVPLGLERWFQDIGITNVRALDWWDHLEVAGATVTVTPVQHWSRRTLSDTNQSLWGGFVIQAVSDGVMRRVFFAGDTGYSAQHFRAIGARLGPFDLALLPIGAYEPRWFMQPQHVDPEEAVQIHRDIRARLSIGVHWGTFQLTDEPLDAPVDALAAARAKFGLRDDEFIVLRHGETRVLG
ncbi:MAG TPA: MBL fold metallo-hydrolase [Burkholderiaceae bacterium]|nr:MBL fold metallo-hydrolase [Burkholderiaceae bacterium]